MSSSLYALVAYVRDPVGEFVEQLRRELHPTLPHMPAHLTILPPRELTGTMAAALEFMQEACRHVLPFSVGLGDVETFLPTTPTVFIEVRQSASRMRGLHDRLNGKGLHYEESWPYVPHLTILKTELDDQARAARLLARERWAQFPGPRQIQVEELTFVSEAGERWQDVALLPLGSVQSPLKL
jgi:2'-5' RNA ligase